MSTTAKAKLEKELEDWNIIHIKDFKASPVQKNGVNQIMRWNCSIPGKESTVWEGKSFIIEIEYPQDYPNSPPKCTFVPALFHPNIDSSGTIFIHLLDPAQKAWKPRFSISSLLLHLQHVVCDPEENYKANDEAHRLYFAMRHSFFDRIQKNPYRISEKTDLKCDAMDIVPPATETPQGSEAWAA